MPGHKTKGVSGFPLGAKAPASALPQMVLFVVRVKPRGQDEVVPPIEEKHGMVRHSVVTSEESLGPGMQCRLWATQIESLSPVFEGDGAEWILFRPQGHVRPPGPRPVQAFKQAPVDKLPLREFSEVGGNVVAGHAAHGGSKEVEFFSGKGLRSWI